MLKLFTNRKSLKIEEIVDSIQNGEEHLRDQLLETYQPFIKKAVSKVCKRYVTESDDEFSIGLIAFNHAIDQFSVDKGSSFLPFANVIIQRRVIDYIRTQNKIPVISMDEEETEDEPSQSSILSSVSIKEYERQNESNQRRFEILSFTNLLKDYDISFQDLVDQTPKHQDARTNAIMVAKVLSQNKRLLEEFFESKKIPVKELTKIVSVSRKTIERNRKYIIGMTLILTGDFPFLKDYMKEAVSNE
ncbi:MAG TPA: RNA polymerase sigma-I factor [Bacillus sp. (in: firmicutes)]|uniref:RNA polymerase sigma-I factor n=1 Tax=Bacillus litorisediminis TaxID=2922713 RepID=UPI001FAC6E2A|nr:RNA polymerase sigma-I factor [Bacillus litorisediminis]HWO74921.1 RNA polymerase sigma-I factor [Bacillus sp. (in: firmicutes)]